MYKIVNRRKPIYTRLADALGWALFWSKKLLPAPPAIDPARVRSILVIRTVYTSDVVITMPMLEPLRGRFSQARLTFLTATTPPRFLSTARM